MAENVLFPDSLPVVAGMRRTADGRAWLARLPHLVQELAQRWDLRLGRPFQGGSCSWVAPVVRADGTSAVLKVTWPHREARPEGEALRLWAGRGAVHVYDSDPQQYALLLELCEPGTELASAPLPAEERLLAGARVLRTLWDAGENRRPTGGSDLEPLADVTGWLADTLDERAARRTWPAEVDTALFTQASAVLRELPRDAEEQTVLHGDFNPGNVLAARRAPWLAIDAKPVYGDAAYDPWPLIQQVDDPFAHADPERVLDRRTRLVAAELGAAAPRLLTWAFARLVEFALWQLETGADDVGGGRTGGSGRATGEDATSATAGGEAASGAGRRTAVGTHSDEVGGGLARLVRLLGQARTVADLAGL